jgi:hypothetical protein
MLYNLQNTKSNDSCSQIKDRFDLLDQGEQNTTSNHSRTIRSDARIAKRVAVKMPVAIVLGKDMIFTALTANFSETGILINDYSGPELQANRLVGVGIRGVITDSRDKDDSEHFLMRVSRQDGNRVALRF